MKRELLLAGAGAVAGAIAGMLLLLRFHPTPPAPSSTHVTVVPEVLERDRPELLHPSIGTKLGTAAVKPDLVQRGPGPSAAGKRRVAAYCLPASPTPEVGSRPASAIALPAPLPLADQVAGVELEPARPTVLPDFTGRMHGHQLTLGSTLSDGTPWQAIYTVRGRAAWQSDGDSAAVRSERLWLRLVHGAPRCAAFGAAGGGLGLAFGQTLREAALTAGLNVLSCGLH